MELITRETSTGDTEYFLFDPQSNREADIKTIICEEIINECNWLDADDRFMEVRYYDWDENELSAIINSDGELLRKGIVEITNFIPPYKHFIILQTGDDLGIARFDYQADEEDQLFAVINEIGEAEGIAVSDEDYEVEAEQLLQRTGMQLDVESVTRYIQQEDRQGEYEGRIFRRKALKVIMDNATITDKVVTREQLETETV